MCVGGVARREKVGRMREGEEKEEEGKGKEEGKREHKGGQNIEKY